jgi:hypothetical protein
MQAASRVHPYLADAEISDQGVAAALWPIATDHWHRRQATTDCRVQQTVAANTKRVRHRLIINPRASMLAGAWVTVIANSTARTYPKAYVSLV